MTLFYFRLCLDKDRQRKAKLALQQDAIRREQAKQRQAQKKFATVDSAAMRSAAKQGKSSSKPSKPSSKAKKHEAPTDDEVDPQKHFLNQV